MTPFSPVFAVIGVGTWLSLLLIVIGLVWLFIRSLAGKEVDRRVIFLFVAFAVAAPLIFPVTFEDHASDIVQKVFDKIESLPEGSTVLISFDFDPAMAPEVQPMANAFTRHVLTRNHKVIFMSLWAPGQSLTNVTLDNVVRREFPAKKEGVDFANLGYKAGNQGVLNVIVTNFKKMFPNDSRNIPLDSMPLFSGVNSCRDLDLILSVGGGFPGPKEWVLFVGDPANVPIGVGVAAVTAPNYYPYYPKQMLGMLGGIKGAAEYESELQRVFPQFASMPTPALIMMGPQTLAHVVVMSFIIIGNVAFFVARRKKRSGA
jgi:hypothetical protein